MNSNVISCKTEKKEVFSKPLPNTSFFSCLFILFLGLDFSPGIRFPFSGSDGIRILHENLRLHPQNLFILLE